MKNTVFQIMILTIFLPIAACAQNYTQQRTKMVEEQLERRGIEDPQVLQAMRSVKRHEFVPEQNRHMAYSDRPLPIGQDQTISQPYIVALMTDYLNLEKGDKMLEIGTGSGYQAAVLSKITPNVYSIEIVEELAERARKTLREQGYDNVRIKIGDGYKGWEEHAPFDGIIVTASPSDVPEPLKKQLAEGGRMVIPVGGTIFQNLVLLEKENGEIKKKEISGVRFVPMLDDKGDRH
ncbi:MAG: protein-L-isoaspartate(D-aspartate) O-methyltransferase [Bacteroidales bacterium]